MKKKAAFIFILSLLLMFSTGCKNVSIDSPDIEDNSWKMDSIVYFDDTQYEVLAVGESDSQDPETQVIDMILTASDGRITLTDNTNGTVYEGTYKGESSNSETTIYKIVLDGKEGYASVSSTIYADDTEVRTMPINLGNYAIYFFEA